MREPGRQWKANNVLDTVLSVIEMCIPWIPVESTIEKDGWSSDSGRNLEQEHTGSDRSVAVDRRSQQVYRRDGAHDSLSLSLSVPVRCAAILQGTKRAFSMQYAVNVHFEYTQKHSFRRDDLHLILDTSSHSYYYCSLSIHKKPIGI